MRVGPGAVHFVQLRHHLDVVLGERLGGAARALRVAARLRHRQLAQLERFTTWLDDKTSVAESLVYYWTQISDGYTMECLPISPITDLFTVTAQDAIELPELRQERAPVQQAVDDLNRSIAAMPRCGIYTRAEIRSALGAASNGRFLLRVVRQRMDNLYERLTGEEID